MRSWFTNYRDLQHRAEWKVREIDQRLHRHRHWKVPHFNVQRQLQRTREGLRIRTLQTKELLGISNSKYGLKRTKSDLYTRIIRNPTYQKFENWWEHSPCPGTTLILGINTFIFLLWLVCPNYVPMTTLYF